MPLGDLGRKRYSKAAKNLRFARFGFVNPFPWMSDPEAMVHLFLEEQGIPFSWRYFDGDSPTRTLLIPDFHPEFTLREYKTVICIIGGFFGDLPGVADRVALGQAALEADGWKVVIWFEHEIRAAPVSELARRDLPVLLNPTTKGPLRPNPYGIPTFMAERRQRLSGLALLKAIFDFTKQEETTRVRRNRRVRRYFRSGDAGRRRISEE